MACANVGGELFAIQGNCPRCAFDLFKGDLILDDVAWDDVPRVACPTCATTYGFRNGKYGPPLKRTGLSKFVGDLAKTATKTDEYKNARAFKITRDEDGRVFCRDL
jgi:nitrite reductase/ring-hydroxylating ferredoxin subunit